MKVAKLMAHFLTHHLQIENFFGVSGANIEDLFDTLEEIQISDSSLSPISLILAKHEGAAGNMADGVYRSTGKIAAVLTTSGGGALNLIPALGEAYSSSIPLLAIIGAPPQKQAGQGAFQDTSGENGTFNLEKVLEPLSGFCKRINQLNDIPHLYTVLKEAYESALNLKKPSVLIIPKDIQTRVFSDFSESFPQVDLIPEAKSLASEFSFNFQASIKESPLVILGEEILHNPKRQEIIDSLLHFSHITKAFILVTPEAKALEQYEHPSFLGVVGTMGAKSSLKEKIFSATSLVIVLGSKMGFMERYGLDHFLGAETDIYIINTTSNFMNKPKVHYYKTDHGHLGPMILSLFKEILSSSLNSLSSSPEETFYYDEAPDLSNCSDYFSNLNNHISINHLGALLGQTFKGQKINWLIDAGNVVCNVVKDLKISSPESSFTIALGMGGMGYSFGAAIGATVASGKPSVVVAGDGSFFMSGMEIHTAIRYQLPICFIIVNNNGHGMCVTRDQIFFKKESSINRFQTSHISQGLLAMFPQLSGFEINNYEDWFKIQDKIFPLQGPQVLVINVDIDEQPSFQPFQDIIQAQKGEKHEPFCQSKVPNTRYPPYSQLKENRNPK